MKKLTRSSENAWVGGVFGGLAEYYGFDPNTLRILFIILTAFTAVPLLIYFIAWFVIPD